MSDITLPNIPHATVTLNERNRIIVTMDNGWVFWDRNDYFDENGNIIEPTPDIMFYKRWGSFSPNSDLEYRLVVVAESDVPADQIFSTVTPPTVTQ
jgi:hypothetical protein